PVEHIRQDAGGYIRDRAMTWDNEQETDWLVAKTGLAGAKWIEENYRRDNWLLWLDTFEIHEDWHPPQYYTDFYSPEYDGPDYTYPNYGYTDIYQPEHIARLRACYSGEVSLTDRWFGHVLRQLELCSLLDDTMVIITSDHGMYLGEHNRMGKHTVDKTDPWPLYDEVSRLPWLMYIPGAASPDATDACIQPADILPTVLELAGVPRGDWPQMDGTSLVPVMDGETDEVHEYIFTSCHSAQGPGRIEHVPALVNVHSADWTLCTGPADIWEPTLHHRPSDPHFCRNVIDKNPDEAARMQAALIEFMQHKGADEEYIEAYTPIG
ncbi:MAG: sulfatase, partial [Armatimonadota bacterium]